MAFTYNAAAAAYPAGRAAVTATGVARVAVFTALAAARAAAVEAGVKPADSANVAALESAYYALTR